MTSPAVERYAWAFVSRQATEGRAGPEPLQAFSKHFQISACFRQAFPKKALAVLWDFKGLQ